MCGRVVCCCCCLGRELIFLFAFSLLLLLCVCCCVVVFVYVLLLLFVCLFVCLFCLVFFGFGFYCYFVRETITISIIPGPAWYLHNTRYFLALISVNCKINRERSSDRVLPITILKRVL